MKITFIINGIQSEIEAEPGHTILDSALMARLNPPYSCLEGSCGTCEAVIESGETSEMPSAEGVVRTCQAVPRSESLVVNFDRMKR